MDALDQHIADSEWRRGVARAGLPADLVALLGQYDRNETTYMAHSCGQRNLRRKIKRRIARLGFSSRARKLMVYGF